MAPPLISCVMATRNRPEFLRQAIHYYLRQTVAASELIIIDDGDAENYTAIPSDSRIRYLHFSSQMIVGDKLNTAIDLARGEVIQKLDDDDYYRRDFLERMSSDLLSEQDEMAVAGVDQFLVWLSSRNELRRAPARWFAGATLCFRKSVWRAHPFPSWDRAEDAGFLNHVEHRLRVSVPELFIVIRHGQNTWRETRDGLDVDSLLMRQPLYARTLGECSDRDAWRFYARLFRIGEGREDSLG